MSEHRVIREIKIEATPDQVWRYLTDPTLIGRWMGVEVDFDAAPGQAFRINVTGQHVALGTIVESAPPERLVYTWGWEGDPMVPPGASTVTWSLRGDGMHTLLTIDHDLGTPEAVEPHTQGWTHYTDRLLVAASGGDPGPDPKAAAASS